MLTNSPRQSRDCSPGGMFPRDHGKSGLGKSVTDLSIEACLSGVWVTVPRVDNGSESPRENRKRGDLYGRQRRVACGFGHCRDPGLSCVRTKLWLVVCAVSLPRSGAVSGWSHPPIPLGLFSQYGGNPISWVFGRGFLVRMWPPSDDSRCDWLVPPGRT